MKSFNSILQTICLVGVAACGQVTSSTHANESTLVSLSPTTGSVIGGTMVTATGTNFGVDKGAYVLVGGHLATNVMVMNATTLAFTAPAGDQEGATVDVEIATSNGIADLAQSFTYNLKPVVLSISPAGGKIVGGTPVTITGRGFMAGGAKVEIAGGMATNVTVVDDKTITATTGAAAAGTRAFVPSDVTVTNANGAGTLPTSYSFTKQGLIAIGTPTRCCAPGSVTFIDPVDGSSVQIATATQHLHGCALSPTGQIFSIGSPSGNSSTVARTLVTIDPLTGTTTSLGAMQTAAAVAHNLGSLTFNSGTLYGVDSGNRSPGGAATHLLYSVNTTNGQITAIGATAMTVQRAHGLAADDASNLFIADTITGTLDTLNTTTGIRTAGKSMTGGMADAVKSLLNTGNGLFIVSQNTSNTVYSMTIGATTVTLTAVAALNGQRDALNGLCPTPPSF